MELSKSNNKEKLNEYLSLRESIRNRILEIDSFFELNFDKPYIYNFETGRIKLKKLLMYEPDTISEFNENKKYILAGYDDIPEEKDNEISYEKKGINGPITKRNYNINYNIQETSFSNNKDINIQNNKNSKNNYNVNNVNKNTFFDDYNNRNNKIKTLNNSTNLKNKINNEKNNYAQNINNKNDKINNNFISKTITQIRNLNQKELTNNKSEDITERNETNEINDNQETNHDNEDKENNNAISLSINSIKDENSTERNATDESFKNKKTSRYKKSYRDSLAQNNMQVREINVRFILTKEEYSILMREKAKHQDFFFS